MRYFNGIENMQYKYRYELDNFYDQNGYLQKLYLVKTFDISNKKEYYFLRLFLLLPNNCEIQKGYLYFYIENYNNINHCKYVGTFVKPEYRNNGVASLLTSSWIKFCLDNDLNYLSTNKKQKKPFLLHTLKKFSFEIKYPQKYNTHPGIIYICKNYNDDFKTLLFKNSEQKRIFEKSSAFRNDNYKIIDNINDDIKIIDKVILNQSYELNDNNKGYEKALHIQKKYK